MGWSLKLTGALPRGARKLPVHRVPFHLDWEEGINTFRSVSAHLSLPTLPR